LQAGAPLQNNKRPARLDYRQFRMQYIACCKTVNQLLLKVKRSEHSLMVSKALKILLAVPAIIVGLYPLTYFFVDRKFGLLQSKTAAVLTNTSWNIAFYTHIFSGGIALLIGWIQFNEKFRVKRLAWHRNIGKVYVTTALISSICSMYIALYATGGIVASSGFLLLGLTWFYSTYRAYTSIRKMDIKSHQKMMTYSYAACLAAVTLRIYLPLLVNAFHDFTTAYLIVAWLCWIPNLVVAYYITKRQQFVANDVLQ